MYIDIHGLGIYRFFLATIVLFFNFVEKPWAKLERPMGEEKREGGWVRERFI